jgi:hypothetical protein
MAISTRLQPLYYATIKRKKGCVSTVLKIAAAVRTGFQALEKTVNALFFVNATSEGGASKLPTTGSNRRTLESKQSDRRRSQRHARRNQMIPACMQGSGRKMDGRDSWNWSI